MTHADNQSQCDLESPQSPPPKLKAPEEFFVVVPPPKETIGQGAWKEARRLGMFSGTFGILTGLLLGTFTHLAAFGMSGQLPESAVRNVLLYCVCLGLLGVAFGGMVGALSGAWKSWRTKR